MSWNGKTIVYFVESFTILIIFLNLKTKNIVVLKVTKKEIQQTLEGKKENKIVCDSNHALFIVSSLLKQTENFVEVYCPKCWSGRDESMHLQKFVSSVCP